MNTRDLIQRVGYLINQGNATIATKHNTQAMTGAVKYELYIGFRSAAFSFIKSLYGGEHPFYNDFTAVLRNYYAEDVGSAIEILAAIKNEISNGWLQTLSALVRADIFANFLEMAEHLLEESYKDAAAVMIGSTLEEHLRQLCETYLVDILIVKGVDNVPKKTDVINADLKKAGAYTAIDQKQVTAWLGLRNSAAHGKYSDYTIEQVNGIYDGVLNFISRTK